jgi:hypothetical protein
MNIAVEPFSVELFDELIPLAQKCWDEGTKDKGVSCAYHGERDYQIEPDRDRYQELDKSGALIIVTLRNDRKLVGYCTGILYRALHHKHILCGNADSLYVEPEHRTYMVIRLIDRFEDELKARGVQIIGWPTHERGPIFKLLQVRGYVGDDIVMEKRLKCA